MWAKKNQIHILIWTLFVFWEAILVGIMLKTFGDPALYVAHYTVIIILFYFQSNVLLPFVVKNNFSDFLRVPLALIFQLAMYISCHFLADVLLMFLHLIPSKPNYGLDYQFILRNLYRGVFFIGFSSGYYFLKRYFNEKKRASDLEKKKLQARILQKNTEQELFKAQNAFLKAQINPHFLFNTLNFIHTKVSTSSPEAADAVIALSEMMRYALGSEDQGGTIILEDEMEQVINLINLFKLRKSSPLYLKAEFADETKHVPFIPLILLTLAENMFKHGQLHDANQQATLKVYFEDEMLIFETRNLSQPQKSDREHTGLANIKQRLLYAYGENINFDYTTDANPFFTLKLGVPLAQLNEPVL